MGLSPEMRGLAGDLNGISGGDERNGAEINSVVDAVDVKAFQLAKRGINAVTDAMFGVDAFRPRGPGGR